MNETLANHYRKIRKSNPHIGAKSALSLARYELSDKADWIWGEEIERDGFTLVFSIDYDDEPFSYCGSFSDRPLNDGSIKNPEGWDRYGERNHHFLAYFTPEVSEAEHYKGLRDLNYGKAQARELAHKYVMEDLERAKEGSTWVVTVKVYRAGIKLASASLGGIDDDGRYAKECAEEIASEAIEEAQAKLAELVKGSQA